MKRTEAVAILSKDLKQLRCQEKCFSDFKGWWVSEEWYENSLTDLRKSIEAHKMAIRALGGATV